jgi:hypothetical protein
LEFVRRLSNATYHQQQNETGRMNTPKDHSSTYLQL